ncbi:mechanosensitive ion channel domain-containing protein [Piscinibacter sakaiensis]|uniref:Potassium efflux system KefA protein/small-conductance mechanosensitive channel n=1 Tax=Piscinibacter sakaiensis TaxID=1547922 RepID=A0A0K8NZM0_PISS1|nr:mechanosensitive ion channel domain-containing protein [Piscinibacter sakaiensis]GAP35729.1 potassium efflux system KefA protein/small-conductance mechanosensitive channel [Piscinibacter sakaiensis]
MATTPAAPQALNLDEFARLLHTLARPQSLVELALLAGCLLVAWGVVRGLRHTLRVEAPEAAAGSIWFGRRDIDGVLWPVIALALAFVAKRVVAGTVQAAVFELAVPVLLSLVVIRVSVRVLGATFPESGWVRVVERSISWLAWLAVVLWVVGILPLLLEAMDDVVWHVGTSRISLRTALEGTISAGLVLVVALWISAGIERRLLRGSGDDLSLRKMAANLVRAALLLVGLLLALSAVGIDLTALSVLGGAVGVGLGFGLQKIAANYVSGFVILAERSLRIGDVVKIDNFEGRITDIRTRYTIVRSLGGREAIVPNEMLITQRVENASLDDPRVSLSTVVQVAYGTDVRALQPQLVETVRRVARVMAEPGPGVQLSSFAADGLELTVNFWIRDPENGQGNVRSEVNLAILDLLNAQGIEIPFPQRVLRGELRAQVEGSPALDGGASAARAEA